jgi:hypothetical protein
MSFSWKPPKTETVDGNIVLTLQYPVNSHYRKIRSGGCKNCTNHAETAGLHAPHPFNAGIAPVQLFPKWGSFQSTFYHNATQQKGPHQQVRPFFLGNLLRN